MFTVPNFSSNLITGSRRTTFPRKKICGRARSPGLSTAEGVYPDGKKENPGCLAGAFPGTIRYTLFCPHGMAGLSACGQLGTRLLARAFGL